MSTWQAVRMAFKSIGSNKMRSFLTVLGVIIGVLSVVVLVSLGQSTTDTISGQLSTLGTNLLTINIRSARTVPFEISEILSLEGTSGIKSIAPLLNKTQTVKAGTENMSTTVEGTTPNYGEIRDLTLKEGRFISVNDLLNRFAVAVVGLDNCDELFSTRENILGRKIIINRREFTIIGVLAEKGSSVIGSNDDRVIIPYTTAQRLFKQKFITTYYAKTENETVVDQAKAKIESLLLKKYNNETTAFSIFDQSTMMETVNNVMGTMTGLLAGIAAISLLVGGIGIMNIMLVSVNERTREIGIRKAIGARKKDVLSQFLIESVVISSLGGMLGLVFGGIVINLVGQLIQIEAKMSISVVLFAVGFSMAVGIIFGMYPANKAANLRPIEALRNE